MTKLKLLNLNLGDKEGDLNLEINCGSTKYIIVQEKPLPSLEKLQSTNERFIENGYVLINGDEDDTCIYIDDSGYIGKRGYGYGDVAKMNG